MENMPTLASVLEMMVCKCRNMCQCQTETNDIKSEIDDESDDNREQSEASDENSEEFDRTHILFPRPFFVSWLLHFKKQKQCRVYELDIQSAGSDKDNIFWTFPLKSQNKHIKIFINFLLTSARKFYLRFKLIGQKIYSLRLIILIFNLLGYVQLFYRPWVEQNDT